jgi:DNA-binding transcriptional LysR family regulator
MLQAGLGWGFLPESLVKPQLNAGTLVEMTLDNISSFSALWVDVIWSNSKPLGLGAQYFIELIRAKQQLCC